MLPQFQRHEEDNLEAAERREQRLMEVLRQSNEMQRGMSAQIEALKTQIAELQSPTSRRLEQKGLPLPPRTVPNLKFDGSGRGKNCMTSAANKCSVNSIFCWQMRPLNGIDS